jgi:NAD(P)-dependent dehydrogenase (short-subunit alcohol dehydrogenase family)
MKTSPTKSAIVTGGSGGIGRVVAKRLAGFLQKEFPLCREHHAARAAAQKVHADLILQVLDLSAQRRLRDSKSRGGLGEVQRFADRQKVSQMS